MRQRISSLLALLLAVLMPFSAFGQSAILQGGPWTSGHAPMYSSPAGALPVLQDTGTAQGGVDGLGLKEFLQVNRGPGTGPYANVGLGPYSANNCFYDGPTTGAYHYLCLDANAQGGALLAVGSGGGASPLPLSFIVNGVTYPFFGLGNVFNSGTPANGQLASWTGTNTIQGATTGANVLTALGVNVGSAGAFVVNGGALGTPSSATLTNAIGLPLTTGVTGNLPVANLNSGTSASASTFWRGDGSWAQPVTSVAQSFTGGLISVAGSPITTTGTLALTVAGTSGGIPYFSSASTWASSGALTANLPVIGGGAGVAPTVGTKSGNTTKFATSSGTLTNGDCVSLDSSGNYVDAGGPCTVGGGGGTVTAGTATQLAYYAATGATVVGNATLTTATVVAGGGTTVVLDIPTWSNTAGTALDDKGANKAPALATSAQPSYSSGYLFRLPRMFSTVTGTTHDHIFGEPSSIVQPSNHSFVGCILCEFYESAAGTTAFVGTDGTATPKLGVSGAGIAAHAHMTAFGPSVVCQGSESLCIGHIATATSPNDVVVGRAKDTGAGTGGNVLVGGLNMTVTGSQGNNVGIGASGTFAGTAGSDILIGPTGCTVTSIANAVGIGQGACPTTTGSIVLGGSAATKIYAGSESVAVPVYASGVVSQGTAPSTNFGTCTRGAWTGGPWVGSFVATGACATGGQYWWTAPKTPPNGLACSIYDQSNPTVTIVPITGTGTSSLKIQVTSATGVADADVIVVSCQGY